MLRLHYYNVLNWVRWNFFHLAPKEFDLRCSMCMTVVTSSNAERHIKFYHPEVWEQVTARHAPPEGAIMRSQGEYEYSVSNHRR